MQEDAKDQKAVMVDSSESIAHSSSEANLLNSLTRMERATKTHPSWRIGENDL